MDIIESESGELDISSEEGRGTIITIKLPIKKEIDNNKRILLQEKSSVVIIDDNKEIHSIWKSKLEKIDFPDKKIVYFFNSDDFERSIQKIDIDSALFLIDYDQNSSKTGIELIETYNLEKNSYLVTSYANEYEMVNMYLNKKIKMIRKRDLHKITLEKVLESQKLIVHLDDNVLQRKMWSLVAEEKSMKLISYSSSQSLFENIDSIPKDSHLFIDQDLGETIKGTDIIIKLESQGFSNVYLTTGYKEEEIKKYGNFKVLGKDFPESLVD